MSRFSRKEAEAAGWRFVHERDQYETVESSTQGRVNITPATIVAEKYVSLPGQTATLVHEEAETEGKLLERIAAYESHLRGLPSAQAAPVDESDAPREIALGEGGDFIVTDSPAGTVIVPADPDDPEAGTVSITDAAWTAANRTDSLVVATEDGTESVTYGGAREDVATAVDAVDAVRKLAEDQRSSEPHPGATKQIEDETVVRKDEDSAAEASDRADEERKLIEDIRVIAAPIDHVVTAPEGADLTAGTDVGLARRTDLESEQPGQGQVAGSGTDSAEPAPVTPATVREVEAGRAAAEDKAKELRDSADSAEEADDANAQQAVEDAGAEATQEAHDDAADEEPDTTDEDQENPREAEDGAETPAVAPADAVSSEPESQSTPSGEDNATDSAKSLAQEKGVDLSKVTGTGKDGRITQPDVQKHLDSQE